MNTTPNEVLILEPEDDQDWIDAVVTVAEELPSPPPKWGPTI